jgi:hypothetical protein
MWEEVLKRERDLEDLKIEREDQVGLQNGCAEWNRISRSRLLSTLHIFHVVGLLMR